MLQLHGVHEGTWIDQAVLGIQDHMKVGMQEGHEMIVKEAEEMFPLFRDHQMHHVHFVRHA